MPDVLDPSRLESFVDALPIPPILQPATAGHREAAAHYRVIMREIRSRVHRDLPPTRFWSYGDSVPGPTIEARSGVPFSVEWVNDLPARHFLPIDNSLCGAGADVPEVRTVVHAHGAIVRPDSDGYPEHWFVPGKSVRYSYPMRQGAATLWYHDHAMGIERLNLYAGLFGAFLIRDKAEDALNLPRGGYEIPLFLFDRYLDKQGQLYYPDAMQGQGSWMPEVFGNAFLVNGKLLPYLEVEPRRYRFRVFNAANARFFRLTLSNQQEFQQIGTEQGLLPAPAAVRMLTLAPGERADVVIDFSAGRGSRIVVNNDLLPVMQFRVASAPVEDSRSLPAQLVPMSRIAEQEAVTTRTLTLKEYDNAYGKPMMMLLNGSRWRAPVTEKPRLGTVEIWNLVNLTMDTHPIHLHQARFQILDRRSFDTTEYQKNNRLLYRSGPIPPEPGEAGWKDTVRANGHSVTRIIVRFDGYAGRYVWHCHNLEHAANEMMRPYDILPA